MQPLPQPVMGQKTVLPKSYRNERLASSWGGLGSPLYSPGNSSTDWYTGLNLLLKPSEYSSDYYKWRAEL
jgi:hypothetical protein